MKACNYIWILLSVLSSLSIAIHSQPVRAEVISVTVNGGRPVALNPLGASIVTVRYTIRVDSPGSVSSARGSLRDGVGGAIIRTVGGSVSRNASQPGIVTVTEQIKVPQAIARRLAAGQPLSYRREFSQSGSSAVVDGDLVFQYSSRGELSLRELSVRFDDESRYRVVRKGEALRARARLKTAGAGSIRGAWEINGPAGSNSSAFRQLQQVNRQITVSGTTVLESPALPTKQPGIFNVRFIPRQGGTSLFQDTFPTLRYFVADGDPEDEISLIRPLNGASLSVAQRFEWQPDPRATAYRLEFRGERSSAGAAGRIVGGVDVRPQSDGLPFTKLKPFTVQRLQKQQAQYWRVIAYDSQGSIISSSAMRRIAVAGGATAE